MLQLQRASAGSGKTYALAKKFIWCLITTSVEGEEPRLRSHSEIIDALPRILAITFTNKATNEMKQRIVDKLAALAAYRGEGRHPDYLDEFISQLGCPAGELSRTCAGALSALLNDYSDFKVSTIDSFFQTVLRTFAYETDISDSYQIELATASHHDARPRERQGMERLPARQLAHIHLRPGARSRDEARQRGL